MRRRLRSRRILLLLLRDCERSYKRLVPPEKRTELKWRNSLQIPRRESGSAATS
jgi:hypothetical protein